MCVCCAHPVVLFFVVGFVLVIGNLWSDLCLLLFVLWFVFFFL